MSGQLHHYLILPRIEVQGANAQPIVWMVAPPPVTAYQGFAHALALALGAPCHAGFAIVHHDIAYLGEVTGGVLGPHQPRAAQLIDYADYSSKNKHAVASQPSVRCHLTVSIVVRFSAELALAEHKIERFLRAARIAGGTIVRHGFDVRDRSLVRPRSHYSREIADRLGTGFVLHERTDLMEMREGDADRLDPFIRTITRPREPAPVPPEVAGDGRKWIIPSALGYAQITPSAPRGMVRGGLDHAFAEPLLGFVEYRSISQSELAFWVPQWPAEGVYVVSTSQAPSRPGTPQGVMS